MRVPPGVIERCAAISRRLPVRGRQRVIRAVFPPERLHNFRSTVRLADGRSFAVAGDSFLEWALLFFGQYEPEITRLLQALITPGATALDIGANIGIHTVTMAKQAGNGRVLAFEPHPQTVQRLRANLALNGLSQTEVVEVALLDRAGDVSLFAGTDCNPATSSLRGYQGWSSTSVKGATLDDVLRERDVERVNVVKIDVEGFESAVLAGAQTMLGRDRPALIFEYMDWAWENGGYAWPEVESMLRDLGYAKFFTIGQRRLVPLLAPPEHPMNILALDAPSAPPD